MRNLCEPLAQAAEHLPFKQGVPGSIPGWLTNGPLVKRLRHRPFTAESWVQFPYGSPFSNPTDGLKQPFVGFLFSSKSALTLIWHLLSFNYLCGYPQSFRSAVFFMLRTVHSDCPNHVPAHHTSRILSAADVRTSRRCLSHRSCEPWLPETYGNTDLMLFLRRCAPYPPRPLQRPRPRR